MVIIKATRKDSVEKAVRHLREGGIIIYPTETSYGIGALTDNRPALEKIKAIKGRRTKPFLILVSSMHMANRYALLGPLGSVLAKEYWPGPLTIIAEMKKKFPEPYFNKKKGIAIRFTTNTFSIDLIKRLKAPITSTSANLSGGAPCYSMQSIVRQFGKNRLEDVLIIDGGALKRKKPTTLVNVKGGKFKVVRKGSLTV